MPTLAIDKIAALRLADLHDSNGCLETLIQRCYEAELRPGDAAVDGGANYGLHTAPMAACVGASGIIHAFEPLPFVAQTLREKFHKCENVIVHQAALAETPGTAIFNHVVGDAELSSLLKRDLGPSYADMETQEIRVECVVLDRLVDTPVRFIKLDLEGYDFYALKGGRALLGRHRPIVALEFGRTGAAPPAGYGPDDFFGFFESIEYCVLDLFGRPFGRTEFDIPWYAREIPHVVVAVPLARPDMMSRLQDNARALI